MIPKQGWKHMDFAPRDGSVIMVLYNEWNDKSRRFMVQPAQWMCNNDGTSWTWRAPWRPGSVAHADGWMTVIEFQAQQEREQHQKSQSPEFDL